jgi:D-amino-acid dehydrogenase
MGETKLQFDHLGKGILHVFSNESEFEHACAQAKFQHQHGCEENVMDWKECLALEPSLAFSDKKIYGGIHAPMDESGDIFAFTQRLAKLCEEKFGAVFHYNTEILSLNDENEEISHVATNRGNMRADAYVMAMGSYSPLLLRPIGIDVPIYPMKGYSVTFPANEYTPTISVTDDALKIVYSRLGARIRVAGTAEFAGYNTDIRQVRIKPILRGIQTLFPRADLSEVQEWACLRPSTPDGPPVIGKTKYKNLFLNTGHGTLGWTQGAGSARIVADIMEGKTPEIALDGLTADRYS